MSAAPLLPVELWLLILDHALDFYPFFSLDPTPDYVENPTAVSNWLRFRGRGDEVTQQRLLLRQVCRSWCEFMDRPEIKHRFARLCDIVQSTPSGDTRPSTKVAELLRIKRIEGSFHTCGVDHEVAVVKQLRERVAAGGTFDTEILTNAGTNLTNFVVHTNPNAFRRLQALGISAYRFHPDDLFAGVSTHFPSMRFLSMRSSTERNSPLGKGLQLPALSTLVIESLLYRGLTLDQWSLPSLCHLQIGPIFGISNFQTLITALAIVGPQLRVLGVVLRRRDNNEYGYERYDAKRMSQLWDHFPKLESLRFPLYLIISHPPPQDHPIRYLVNSDLKPIHCSWLAPTSNAAASCTDALIAFCQATPGLVSVRESHDWTWAGPRDQDFDFMIPEQQDTCRHMAEVERRLGANNIKVRLEDVNGKTSRES